MEQVRESLSSEAEDTLLRDTIVGEGPETMMQAMQFQLLARFALPKQPRAAFAQLREWREAIDLAKPIAAALHLTTLSKLCDEIAATAPGTDAALCKSLKRDAENKALVLGL